MMGLNDAGPPEKSASAANGSIGESSGFLATPTGPRVKCHQLQMMGKRKYILGRSGQVRMLENGQLQPLLTTSQLRDLYTMSRTNADEKIYRASTTAPVNIAVIKFAIEPHLPRLTC